MRILRVVGVVGLVGGLAACGGRDVPAASATPVPGVPREPITYREPERLPPPQTTPEPVDGGRVTELAIARDVRDRTPRGVADTFPANVGKLWCFSRIEGMTSGRVVHVWRQRSGDGWVDQARIELRVKGTPWRTWSTRAVRPGETGMWRVDVVAGNGTTLKSIDFRIAE